jgi:transposase-like protein
MIYDDEEGIYVLAAKEPVECPKCESEDVAMALALRDTQSFGCDECGYYFTITRVPER